MVKMQQPNLNATLFRRTRSAYSSPSQSRSHVVSQWCCQGCRVQPARHNIRVTWHYSVACRLVWVIWMKPALHRLRVGGTLGIGPMPQAVMQVRACLPVILSRVVSTPLDYADLVSNSFPRPSRCCMMRRSSMRATPHHLSAAHCRHCSYIRWFPPFPSRRIR